MGLVEAPGTPIKTAYWRSQEQPESVLSAESSGLWSRIQASCFSGKAQLHAASDSAVCTRPKLGTELFICAPIGTDFLLRRQTREYEDQQGPGRRVLLEEGRDQGTRDFHDGAALSKYPVKVIAAWNLR
uniref:Uncharacterized protein n=1 Tax=Steinernema glaseri TaxID=37863 RepID=A0A1I7Y181_9BILA